MLLFVTFLHIILCVMLMLVILLQPGKGADMGSAFGGGGGSSSIFGPRGAGNLLSRATSVVAFLFLATSITLAIYSNVAIQTGTDLEDELQRLQQEKEQGAAAPVVPEPAAPEPATPEPTAPAQPEPAPSEPAPSEPAPSEPAAPAAPSQGAP